MVWKFRSEVKYEEKTMILYNVYSFIEEASYNETYNLTLHFILRLNYFPFKLIFNQKYFNNLIF